MTKISKKAKNQKGLAAARNKKTRTFSALMRSLKHVKSSGPYTRDEMNER